MLHEELADSKALEARKRIVGDNGWVREESLGEEDGAGIE